MAEKSPAVRTPADLGPAEIRAEMAAARTRISAHIDAVETQVWQRVGAVQDPSQAREKLSTVGTILNALVLAEKLGVLRYLKARVFDRRFKTSPYVSE